MANAYKCDNCGVYFDKHFKTERVQPHKRNVNLTYDKRYMTYDVSISITDKDSIYADLCDACLKSITLTSLGLTSLGLPTAPACNRAKDGVE